MTDQSVHPSQVLANATLAFLDAYQRFFVKVTEKMKADGFDRLSLARNIGERSSRVQEFLDGKVVSSGSLLHAFAKYADAAEITNTFESLMAPFKDNMCYVGLASLAKPSVQLALDIHVAFDRDSGKLNGDQYSALFPHPEIVKRVLRFHRESIRLLVGTVASDIEEFLCSSAYSDALASPSKSIVEQDAPKPECVESVDAAESTDESSEPLLQEYRQVVQSLISKYGTKKKAATALKIHVWNLFEAEFKKLRVDARLAMIERIRSGIPSKETPPDRIQEQVPFELPAYNPGQTGIDYATMLIRLLRDVLSSFSRIPQKDQRSVIRAALDQDIAMLVQTIRVHAADYPAEVARLLGGEDLIRQLGLGSVKSSGRK